MIRFIKYSRVIRLFILTLPIVLTPMLWFFSTPTFLIFRRLYCHDQRVYLTFILH